MKGPQESEGAHEVVSGVWRIALPTPWPVGSVNAYLVLDDPLTLVDTGPAWGATEAALEEALAAVGRRVEDLGRIILSHQHVDHWGLAARLVERSGAEVCALDGLDSWLGAYPAALEAEHHFAQAVMRRHGAGDMGMEDREEQFAAPVEATRQLHDGELLEFAGRRLRVLHRPGHSPSDTVLHDEDRGLLIAADHLMARPSTAILAPPLDGSWPESRPRAFADYLDSLRATGELGVELVLPGHGEPVHDPADLLERRLRRYDSQTERVARTLGGQPRTAHEILADVRGRVPDRAVYFALCDVLGYLDRLVDAGAAVEGEDDDVATFALAA